MLRLSSIWKASKIVQSALLVAALLGCSHIERPPIPKVIVDPPPPDSVNGTYTLDQYNTDLTAYASATGDAQAVLRNKMAYGVMAEIDYVYRNYEVSLFMNQSTFNVLADTLQLGLATATTITNGERAKTVLGAVLTGVTGTTLSIDKNFFRQQTVQALISSMQANRDRIKALIIQRLDTQDTATYPYQAVRSDLINYFFAGTLPAALQQLHQVAGTNAETQRAVLEQVSTADLKNSFAINAAIAADKANGFPKTKQFLTLLGVQVDPTMTDAQIEAAVRSLAPRTIDPEFRTKYFAAAKSAGLIN